jgi:hypothetical protein
MSQFKPVELVSKAQAALLGLTLFEVAQARDWALALAQRTGDLYRAEAITSADGALIVGMVTPSSKEDAYILPGDFNWHILRTYSGIQLVHPVNGGAIATFADIDSALAELACIEDGFAMMRAPSESRPMEDIRAVA